MISTYLGYTVASKDMVATLGRIASQAATKRETDYYNVNIGKVKSVDDFMGDYRLYSYAMKAFGLEDQIYAKALMKLVLTSDLSDPQSYANRLADPRYKEFATAFNFGATSPFTAQTANTLIDLFGSGDDSDDDSIGLYQQSFANEEATAKAENDYYSKTIGTITSVDDFLKNTRLRNYVLKAYGIDPTHVSNTFLKSMLLSDINDPNSFVNLKGSAADKAIVAQFNFNADGTVSGLTDAQKAEEASAKTESDYYSKTIDRVANITDILSDDRLRNYILGAYGIDPASMSTATLKAILTSDVNDPNSFVNVNGTAAEKAMAAQFGFNADGSITGSKAQTAAQIANVMDTYNTTVPSFVTDAGAAANSTYYGAHIGSITSAEDLTADPRLFNYITTAFALNPNMSASDFIAAAKDPRLAASKGLANVFAQFNFQTDTADNDAYYKAHIGSVRSVVQLTADPRLFDYVKTAYGLDPELSADVFNAITRDPELAGNNTDLANAVAHFHFQTNANTANNDAYYRAHIGAVRSVADLTADPRLFDYVKTAIGLDAGMSATDFNAAVVTGSLAQFFNFQPEANATNADAYYKAHISAVRSVEDLTSDPRLFDYVKTAYGIDQTLSAAEFDAAAKDPDLAASSNLVTVFAQFNFKADGTVANGTQAQTSANVTAASKSYLASFPAIVPDGTQAETTAQIDMISARYAVIFPGSVANGDQAQTGAEATAITQAYVIAHSQFQADAAENDAYYKANIGSIASVEDLTADQRLFDYVKAAYGIDRDMSAVEFNAAAKDPSLAAKHGLTKVFAQFNFEPDGSVAVGTRTQTLDQVAATSRAYLIDATPDGAVAAGDRAQTAGQLATTTANYMANSKTRVQTAQQKATVMEEYNMTVPSFTTAAGAEASDAYYKSKIGFITSVDELVSDPQLFEYVKTAVNMDKIELPNASDAVYKFDFIQSVKNASYAEAIGMTDIVAMFNFLPDGTVTAGSQAQTGDQLAALSKAYFVNVTADHTALLTNAVNNYQSRLEDVKDIDDFLESNLTADTIKANDTLPELYEMALRAFGIGPGEVSKSEVKKILESDPYDPKSYVNSLKDKRLTDFAKAFNFDANGELKPPVQALSQTQINSYISTYSRNMQIGLTGAAAKKASSDAKAAGTYFATNIVKVKTLDDFLKDNKLTSLVLTANGIDPKSVDSKTLKKAFESDPADPRSFINTADGRKFQKIVDAFNFETKTKPKTANQFTGTAAQQISD